MPRVGGRAFFEHFVRRPAPLRGKASIFRAFFRDFKHVGAPEMVMGWVCGAGAFREML